ncbi:kinase-like protein [Meira miltonrushii]|uniref:non-specific serine/threonine protein kinase n=1 Tax=Meira miltonrushii TaxID=1280837 RepID=A0A316V8N2_9BASI|nr:kinase-like protein [Meira miltonrushii]PWN31845.1 kinase-like protein [Meira miltonrushii]
MTPPKGQAISIPNQPSAQPSSSSQSRIVTPLFDPHGLGSALADSTDEEYQVLPKNDPPIAQDDRENSEKNQSASHAEEANRRGRRRRSSEFVTLQSEASHPNNAAAGTTGSMPSPAPKREESTASQSSRLWWQRGEDGGAGDMTSSEVVRTPSSSINRQRPVIDVNIRQARSRQASDGTTGSSQSPMIRSPAAAFLSSMNDSLASPPSSVISTSGGRNYSLSPSRNGNLASSTFDAIGSSMPNTRSMPGSQESAGQLGLARAAAQLYNTVQASPSLQSMSSFSGHHVTTIKPDEEGARLGPGGRYILGKTIGFGGFSTVREAWDMGEGAKTDAVDDNETKNWHRVAVKIVYSSDNDQKENIEQTAQNQASKEHSDELELWKSIPAHPNLLPLLYHERIHLDETTMANGTSKTIDFLVMPFCEGNLLTYVRLNGESLQDIRTGPSSRKNSVVDTGLERSASNRSSRDAADQSENPTTRYNRTGSGFIPHGHRSNTANDRIVSAPLSVLLARSSSLATSPASNASPGKSVGSLQTGSILRSASMRQRQASIQPSRGLPVSVAKDVLRQVAEALLCLHHKASVLHGDIKLENVLGQQWIAPHTHHPSTSSEEAMDLPFGASRKHTRSNDSDLSSNPLDPTTNVSICWRVADFGLARKIPSKEEVKGEPEGHWVPSLGHARTYGHRTSKHNQTAISQAATHLRRHSSYAGGISSAQPRSQAGSLAYAAPEIFLMPEMDDPDGVSPFAPDMWALGCVVYALFAGRLPFSDTFEPRLQNKIIQGKWDLPERLKRRTQRPEKRMKLGDTSSTTNGDTSMSRAESFGEGSHLRRQTVQQGDNRESFISGLARRATEGVPVDMSASMPSLPPRRSDAMTKSDSNQSIIIADQSELSMSQNIGEEDPMSDDETTDVDFDGKSKDRVAIRRILHGLLEPDATKRWTILQLSQDEWISGGAGTEFGSESVIAGLPSAISSERLKQPPNSDLPSSLREAIDPRPSNVAHTTIPEYDDVPELEQDNFAETHKKRSSYFSGYMDEQQGDIRRGRAPRRANVGEEPTNKSKPIAIDRSKSRSRSRVRDDTSVWGPDITPGGGFNRRQQQQQQQQEIRNSPSYEYRPQLGTSVSDTRALPTRTTRSSSVDQHHGRGRRLIKSQGGAGTGNDEHIGRKGERSESRSASGSGRGGSRSRSRSRRADLDLIMPQLSLHRSHLAHEVEDVSSREASPAPAAALHPDDHNVERTSTWKSPFRARDRLVANLKGGSGQNSSGTSTPKDRRISATEPATDQISEEHHSQNEERPWWQRGPNSKH